MEKLGIIGLGYIGLPTAAMFAASGMEVVGVDTNQQVRDSVNAGVAHIEEGDLNALVSRVVSQGLLRAVAEPEPCDAFIIAVPTPVSADGQHDPDISYVQAAARSIAPVLAKGALVILESTSPVGTTETLRDILAKARPDLSFAADTGSADISIAYCPERIIPGRMLEELKSNDRIVGGLDALAAEKAVALYSRFVRGACIETDARTAEMVKLTENAFRDVNIAFANELSMICESLGVSAWDVVSLANRHPRVSILTPGPGVGGHCIAVDPWFIVSSAPRESHLIRCAREVNLRKTKHVIEKLDARMAGDPRAVLGCFGLTYKADVDDFRESPALEIAETLSSRYPGRVIAVDPFADALARQVPGKAKALDLRSMEEAVEAADIMAILVPHTVFRSLVPTPGKLVEDVVGLRRN